MAPNSNSTVLPSGRKVTRTSFSGGIVFPVASLIGFRPSLPSCMCAAANDFAGAKQTAEKHRFRCENDEKHTSVAKATEVCFSSFSHRNRCFSAVCLAPAKSFAAAHMQDGKEGRNQIGSAA